MALFLAQHHSCCPAVEITTDFMKNCITLSQFSIKHLRFQAVSPSLSLFWLFPVLSFHSGSVCWTINCPGSCLPLLPVGAIFQMTWIVVIQDSQPLSFLSPLCSYCSIFLSFCVFSISSPMCEWATGNQQCSSFS